MSFRKKDRPQNIEAFLALLGENHLMEKTEKEEEDEIQVEETIMIDNPKPAPKPASAPKNKPTTEPKKKLSFSVIFWNLFWIGGVAAFWITQCK